ncbi:30S ribosomal protein S6 [Candidatus Kaiserbacteria bacterium]|nr:30S ribosomal protein S6 [Candidatus Kaiserbacteria bacterium]
MVVAAEIERTETDSESAISRIYEVGYHVVPMIAEDQVEKIVSEIRSAIEQAGGSFIAEGAPSLTKLSYDIETKENGKKMWHDRGYFGWIKFESTPDAARMLEEMLRRHPSILRCIVFQTVREETRARLKVPTIREVKRTDTIKSTPRREEAAAGPVSEEDLDKAISDLTTE